MPIDYMGDLDLPCDEWRSVAGVPLGELVELGIFDWSLPALDWSKKAYSKTQYTRVCDAFIQRYCYRELSIYPFFRWAQKLHYKITVELCAKYNPLYKQLKNVNPLADSDEYGKRRIIESDYPETLLGGNADYTSRGKDEQYEDVKIGSYIDSLAKYNEQWRAVDALFLDELECMFAGFASTVYNVD